MADEPTLGEVFRGVGDIKADLRAVRLEMLRADVYAANRLGDETRLRVIEGEIAQIKSERATARKLLYGTAATAAASLVVQTIIALAASH